MNNTYYIVAGVVILGLGAFGFSAQSNVNIAKKQLVELEQTLHISNEAIVNLQTENATLTEKIKAYEDNINSLQEENQELDEQNEELEKLTETDPELLKKYSKVYFLNENYTPKKIVAVDPDYIYPVGKKVEYLRDAYKYLKDMLEDANDDDVELKISSGYRSFETQKNLKGGYNVVYGAGTANQFSAEQGYSEHQIGTAVDFTTVAMGGALITSFDQTTQYRWLVENAYKYGFILSYPKGNTYYQYEPWHWRFVGESLARKLHKQSKNFYDLDQREIDKYLIEIFD